MKSLVLFALLLSVGSVSAQKCGLDNNVTCSSSGPCCSEFGFCGTSSIHCGGGCQSLFSYSTNPGSASCFVDRPGLGKKCISGHYDFTANTWIQNSDAFNGDPTSTDFVVDTPSNLLFGQNGGLMLLLKAPTTAKAAGLGVKVATSAYMMYGRFTAVVKSGSIPGMVTSFISMSDERDEIDWEWTGGDLQNGQSNMFYRGVIDYTNSGKHPVNGSTASASYEYTVDWNADRIQWIINGQLVRTMTRNSTFSNGIYSYPSTPSRIEFSVWDGGAGAAGTRNWAGGYIDWTRAINGAFNATFMSVTVQCQGDPKPLAPPVRPPGATAPTLHDAPWLVTVPGLPGFTKTAGGDPFSSALALSSSLLLVLSMLLL